MVMDILLEMHLKMQSLKHDAVLRLVTSHTFLMQTLRVAARTGCDDSSTQAGATSGSAAPVSEWLGLES